MIVTATEFKSNLGKYLELVATQDVYLSLIHISLGEDTRVIMESTGRYHEPVAAALHELSLIHI